MLRLHGQGSKSHCLIVHVEYNLRNVCLYCMHVPKCVLHERLPFLTILVLVSYICPINSMNDYKGNFNHYHSIFIARSTIAIWGSRRTDPPSFPLTIICFPLFPPILSVLTQSRLALNDAGYRQAVTHQHILIALPLGVSPCIQNLRYIVETGVVYLHFSAASI